MHLCFVCEEYPPAPHGGTGSSYRDLAEGLVAVGHRVTVVGVYPAKRLPIKRTVVETLNGVRVVRMPTAPRWMRYKLGAMWDRRKLVRQLRLEHARCPMEVIEASDYAGWLRYGGPRDVLTVVRIRGSNLFFDTELRRPGDAFEHRLERESLARAHCLAAVSRYAAQRTLEMCGLAQRECTVIYNAVDTEMFAPSSTVQPEPRLIVFVNSLNPKKGIEQLIEGMNHVWASHPEARLVAIGQDTQNPEGGSSYVDRLRERVRPEFRQRVTFTGRLPRMAVCWTTSAGLLCAVTRRTWRHLALQRLRRWPWDDRQFTRRRCRDRKSSKTVCQDSCAIRLIQPTSAGKLCDCLTTGRLATGLGRRHDGGSSSCSTNAGGFRATWIFIRPLLKPYSNPKKRCESFYTD